MDIPVYQVDAFAHKPFTGNPAAVCVLPEDYGDREWMQLVGKEMNLSETAFLQKIEGAYNLRWFTPTMEVDLCGHATLASAHILWEKNYTKQDTIQFHTRSGTLSAWKEGQLIYLDFPAEPPSKLNSYPEDLDRGLEVNPLYVGRNRFDYLVEVADPREVENLKPNFSFLERIETRGIIVTARSNMKKYDFISRFFAPAAGVKEDPVTGSAHCCLGPFWGERFGKTELKALQVSERGGEIKVSLQGERVHLGGRCITILEGKFCAPAEE